MALIVIYGPLPRHITVPGTWIMTDGDPDPTIGVDGDFAFDSTDNNLWVKVDDAWSDLGIIGLGGGGGPAGPPPEPWAGPSFEPVVILTAIGGSGTVSAEDTTVTEVVGATTATHRAYKVEAVINATATGRVMLEVTNIDGVSVEIESFVASVRDQEDDTFVVCYVAIGGSPFVEFYVTDLHAYTISGTLTFAPIPGP